MTLLHTFTPAPLVGAGLDEWVTDGLTFKSLSATDIIFAEGDSALTADRFRVAQGEHVRQTAGSFDWATKAHNAGEARTFEFWATLDFFTSGTDITLMAGTGPVATGQSGFSVGMAKVPLGVLFLRVGKKGTDEINVASSVKPLVVPTSELAHFGVAFEQTGADINIRWFSNGEFEERTETYGGIADASLDDPIMWFPGLGTGAGFFDGAFYLGRVYDHMLTQQEILDSFGNPPVSCAGGGSGPLGSSSTLTRAYSAKDRLG